MRRIVAMEALRAPAFALGATMAGFATIAREAGFDFWMAVTTSALVWGNAGSGGVCKLYSASASLHYLCRGHSCQYADATNGRISR